VSWVVISAVRNRRCGGGEKRSADVMSAWWNFPNEPVECDPMRGEIEDAPEACVELRMDTYTKFRNARMGSRCYPQKPRSSS
jgi:hypothetical protein